MRVMRDNGIRKGDVRCMACRGGVRRISKTNDLLETRVQQLEKQKEDAQGREKDLMVQDLGENHWIVYEDFSTFYDADLGKKIAEVHWVPEGCQIVD